MRQQAQVLSPTPVSKKNGQYHFENSFVDFLSKVSVTLTSIYFSRRVFTKTDQLDYIRAVKCLRALPAQTSGIHAGAKSRHDDFQALYIDQTDYIHWCVSGAWELIVCEWARELITHIGPISPMASIFCASLPASLGRTVRIYETDSANNCASKVSGNLFIVLTCKILQVLELGP